MAAGELDDAPRDLASAVVGGGRLWLPLTSLQLGTVGGGGVGAMRRHAYHLHLHHRESDHSYFLFVLFSAQKNTQLSFSPYTFYIFL